MNENCQQWHGQIKELRKKHAEFMQTYAAALKFAEQNPKIRETSFTSCRVLFNEIKPLVMALREDFPRLTKEQKTELKMLKTNFDALPQLHEGIKWEEVEKALMAAPDAINKLRALDIKGHKMNVFGEENNEFIFASAWENVELVSTDHRNICFDAEGQKVAENKGCIMKNGNAVDIATAVGVDLADTRIQEKLSKATKVIGNAWLKTEPAKRKSNLAYFGNSHNARHHNHPENCNLTGSFRAELRVKKV